LSPSPVVVVSGLNNPRQLSLVDGVELLIAEAGKGGDTQLGEGDDAFFVGTTGSISAVWFPQHAANTSPHRIVTGLMSGSGEDGSGAVGSDGVSARGVGGPLYIQETWAPPDVLPGPLGSTQDGRLLVARHGALRSVADITAFEAANDPDGQGFNSDPYAVLALPGGELVADAAANAVLWVDRRGHVSIFHVFPNVTSGDCASQEDPPGFPGCNYVPTSLATDRWGNVYVGGLSSETPGEAQVVKLDRSGQHVLRIWSGFTMVTGVAVGHDGALYVSQLFAEETAPIADGAAGVLTKIDSSGTRTNMDVPFPAGVAVDKSNNVYVSALSLSPDTGVGIPGIDTSGQVWRVRF
jgi:hypothetical protein